MVFFVGSEQRRADMTIATKGGGLILKDGRLSENCACCQQIVDNTCGMTCIEAAQAVADNFYFTVELLDNGSSPFTLPMAYQPYTCVFQSVRVANVNLAHAVFSSDPDLSASLPVQSTTGPNVTNNYLALQDGQVLVEVWSPCVPNVNFRENIVVMYVAEDLFGTVVKAWYLRPSQGISPSFNCSLSLNSSNEYSFWAFLNSSSNHYRFRLAILSNPLP
jgi:hypothetical protein